MITNRTLREKVYHYLRQELAKGTLLPGSFINQNEICEKLSISRAPMRDALIQLETEQFVEILPRRGVLIRKLTAQDIQNSYEILGTLESALIFNEFDKLNAVHVGKLTEYNEQLKVMLEKGKFEAYFEIDLDFHNVFLKLSDNRQLRRMIILPMQRLYDFPQMKYDDQWERINYHEHQRLIYSVRIGNREAAANIIKNELWSFKRHEKYLKKVYQLE
ncbi:GntR family transcriptional regulator [Desulfococcaceae bacterium HSG9]|nr:GntR family transcriptional regulator [Desulfococcaceae bacterium HSG9]